jgi:hypothetical protein
LCCSRHTLAAHHRRVYQMGFHYILLALASNLHLIIPMVSESKRNNNKKYNFMHFFTHDDHMTATRYACVLLKYSHYYTVLSLQHTHTLQPRTISILNSTCVLKCHWRYTHLAAAAAVALRKTKKTHK